MKSKMNRKISALAEQAGAELVGHAEKIVSGAAPFDTAGPEDITLAESPKYLRELDKTKAGAVIVPETFNDYEKYAEAGELCLLRAKNPRAVWARIMQVLYPVCHPTWGVSDSMHAGRNFRCGEEPNIGPYCVIGDDVTIGDRAVIYPLVSIGDGCVLGDDVVVYSNVSIGWGSRIGNRCVIHSGTVIGGDGFGFAPDGGKWEKIPQTGIVQIDDDVEIGALNTIDRATFGKTHIGSGVKTDNQVHLAHNVTVGENSLFVAQVGVAGSARIGKNVIMAGRSGVSQHVSIGDGAVIGPTAAVAKDVPPKAVLSGAPAIDHRRWLRVQRIVPELPELKKKIDKLEKMLEKMSSKEI